MPGFSASIIPAFILGVELFDYMVYGENLQEPGWRQESQYDLKMGGESNSQDAMTRYSVVLIESRDLGHSNMFLSQGLSWLLQHHRLRLL